MKTLPSLIPDLHHRVVLILICSVQTEEEIGGRVNVAGLYRQGLELVSSNYTHT